MLHAHPSCLPKGLEIVGTRTLLRCLQRDAPVHHQSLAVSPCCPPYPQGVLAEDVQGGFGRNLMA